jgi:hypothetical protein
MIFCTVLDAAIQLREHHISKRNYEISVVQKIHISKLEIKRWSLEFVIFFSKVYFGIEVWLIPFGIMQSKSLLVR